MNGHSDTSAEDSRESHVPEDFTSIASRTTAAIYRYRKNTTSVASPQKEASIILASARAGLRHSMALEQDPRLDIAGTHPTCYIREHGQRASSWISDCQDVTDSVRFMYLVCYLSYVSELCT